MSYITGQKYHLNQIWCFDLFKTLRLFVYVLNQRIDVVLKASRAVVILKNIIFFQNKADIRK
jgi:hypothetical protein